MSKVYGNIINHKDTITPQQKNDSDDITIEWNAMWLPMLGTRDFELKYIDQFIPAPLNALVPINLSDNDILLGNKEFMKWSGNKPCILKLGDRKFELYASGCRIIPCSTYQPFTVSADHIKILETMAGKAVLTNDYISTATDIINNHSTSMTSFTTNRYFSHFEMITKHY